MTRAKSWLLHVQGAATLIRLRGDQNFSSTFSQQLFLGARMNVVGLSVARRGQG